MKAIQLEVTCREWWGRSWRDSRPFVVDATVVDAQALPNAPLCVYVLTKNAEEAVQLLRLTADALEANPSLIQTLRTDDDSEEVAF